MDVMKILEVYPIPISVVVTLLLAWAFNKFIAPNIKSLTGFLTQGKDAEIENKDTIIEGLSKRLDKLEKECDRIKKEFNSSQIRENRLIGLLTGLSLQLKELGVDISEEIEKIAKL